MKGIYQNIRSRLSIIIGAVTLIFIMVLIIQYNNYFFTNKTLDYNKQINQTLIVPEQLIGLQNRFQNKDLFNDQIYTLGQRSSIDSIQNLLVDYQNDLEKITSASYLLIDKNVRIRIQHLKEECQKLSNKYGAFKRSLFERGLYSTGASGEWQRFGFYIQELAFSTHNIVLIKKTTEIIRLQSIYQLNKTNTQIQQIQDAIDLLKVSLLSGDKTYSQGFLDADRNKFIKELDNLNGLTISLQNTDAKLGLSGSAGTLGDINLQLSVIQDISSDIYDNITKGIHKSFFRTFLLKILFIIILAALCILFLTKISETVQKSVSQIKDFASDLVAGKMPPPVTFTASSELVEISTLFNNFIVSLREKIQFATNLGSDRNNGNLVPLSDDDNLANSLLNMEKSLDKAGEEDKKYKEEEQKRTWTNEGLAKFSEILRMQTNDLTQLSDEIIAHLVKYLNANQGGIFLYNDENYADVHLELSSSFAYNRKKYINKRVEVGEGLVGTCVLEKQTIFMTDIPEHYIEISSGLGDASPRSLLLVPLKTQEGIFGVIELASFYVFQVYEIEFVERLAQSIASTFATVKININTTRLLEQSKKQAEEMAQQEEEMRQNLEELQATQEESARREAEINSLIHAVDISSLVIQMDMEGRILEVNRKCAEVLKLRRDELISHSLKSLFLFNHDNDEYYSLIQNLKQGKSTIREEEIHHPNGTIDFLTVHYSPILDKEGQPYKILGIANSNTETKTFEHNMHKKQDILNDLEFRYNQYTNVVNNGFIHCELSPFGEILEINDNYSEMSGYHRQELIGKEYRKFLKQDELHQFELVWAEVHKDKSYTGVIKRTKPTGDESWLISCFLPFKDSNGNISKIYVFALDITEKKLKYQVLEEANKEIERLKGMLNPS